MNRQALFAVIEAAAGAQGLTDEHLQRLAECGAFDLLFDARSEVPVREHLAKALGLSPTPYEFTMNYELSLSVLLSATGADTKYETLGYHHGIELPKHNKHGAVKLTAKVFPGPAFQAENALEKANAIVTAAGYRHATFWEGLAFAAAWPKVQIQYGVRAIIALGTAIKVTDVNYRNEKNIEEAYLELTSQDVSIDSWNRRTERQIRAAVSPWYTGRHILAVREV